jgi:hypothetical protein
MNDHTLETLGEMSVDLRNARRMVVTMANLAYAYRNLVQLREEDMTGIDLPDPSQGAAPPIVFEAALQHVQRRVEDLQRSQEKAAAESPNGKEKEDEDDKGQGEGWLAATSNRALD